MLSQEAWLGTLLTGNDNALYQSVQMKLQGTQTNSSSIRKQERPDHPDICKHGWQICLALFLFPKETKGNTSQERTLKLKPTSVLGIGLRKVA